MKQASKALRRLRREQDDTAGPVHEMTGSESVHSPECAFPNIPEWSDHGGSGGTGGRCAAQEESGEFGEYTSMLGDPDAPISLIRGFAGQRSPSPGLDFGADVATSVRSQGPASSGPPYRVGSFRSITKRILGGRGSKQNESPTVANGVAVKRFSHRDELENWGM
eukprot:Rmarinus@m.21677